MSHKLHVGFALVVLAAAGCLRDASGPRTTATAGRGLVLSLESAGAGVVDIDRVRAIVMRPDEESVVLDTLVQVPAGADSLELALEVPVSSESETFLLTLEFITPTGEVAFVAGPLTVTASTAADAGVVAVEVDAVYVGVGANAAAVRIVEKDAAVASGDTVTLNGEALDSAGTVIAGTPIEWSSLDPTRADVPDARVGRVAGGTESGVARVEAKLLTGQADTIDVLVFTPLANSVTDPLGDTFETTASDGLVVPDIVQFGAEVLGGELVIQIDFAQPMVSVIDGGPNVVVGLIDIDTDQDPLTGGFPNTDVFRPDAGSTGMGIEYWIDLFTVDPQGAVSVVEFSTGLTTASIVPVFSGTVVIMRVPLTALGGDDGNVNLATVLGDLPEPTDIAPNNGHLAISGGAVGIRPKISTAQAPPADPRRLEWPPAQAKRE